ncbi:CHAD domain-containing protein [Campylobacter concisus]|nr:CHAD domain-containing protein [Campylobacter concisus]MCA6129671.1 CHAD domain-containing protein [Campylobacter concisus]MCA6131744.1 CHAD domain-containing protein [Campylobacter concisus]
MEIERKFLLKNSQILDFLKDAGVVFKHLEISQFYTKITQNEEIRFRSEEDKFIKTIKVGKDLIREENEEFCEKAEFKKALKNRIGRVITKDRYIFRLNNNPCNIDVFKDGLNGLCTFEIEFADENEAVYFKLPAFLEQFCQADVTCDKRYKNKFLAIHANENEQIDYKRAYSVFKNKEISPNFAANLKSGEALRALFLSIFKEIKRLKSDYLQNHDEEILHNLRVNLRKVRSLLKIFNGVFDEKVMLFFGENFKILANSTNKKRDLDIFLGFLGEQKHANELIYFVQKALNLEYENVKSYLGDEENYAFLKEWEIFLNEGEFYRSKLFDVSLSRLGSFKLRTLLVLAQKRLKSLDQDCPNESFHKIRIELKKVRYTYEFLSEIFYFDGLKKYEERLKDMQEIFGALQDYDVWLGILERLPVAAGKEKLESKIYKQIYKTREEILKKRLKFIKATRKISRNLRIYYI